MGSGGYRIGLRFAALSSGKGSMVAKWLLPATSTPGCYRAHDGVRRAGLRFQIRYCFLPVLAEQRGDASIDARPEEALLCSSHFVGHPLTGQLGWRTIIVRTNLHPQGLHPRRRLRDHIARLLLVCELSLRLPRYGGLLLFRQPVLCIGIAFTVYPITSPDYISVILIRQS